METPFRYSCERTHQTYRIALNWLAKELRPVRVYGIYLRPFKAPTYMRSGALLQGWHSNPTRDFIEYRTSLEKRPSECKIHRFERLLKTTRNQKVTVLDTGKTPAQNAFERSPAPVHKSQRLNLHG